jgi:hypothetical protein
MNNYLRKFYYGIYLKIKQEAISFLPKQKAIGRFGKFLSGANKVSIINM